MYDIYENITIINSAKALKVNAELIKLNSKLLSGLELLKENFDFIVQINYVNAHQIYFEIAVKYPDNLPDDIGLMFFDIDNKFDVKIVESNHYIDQRIFEITINLHQ